MNISLSFKPPLLNVSAGLIYLSGFAKGRHSCSECLSVLPSGLHTLYFSEMSRRTKKLKGRFYGTNSTAFWIQHLYNNVCFAHWSLGYFVQAVLWNWFSENVLHYSINIISCDSKGLSISPNTYWTIYFVTKWWAIFNPNNPHLNIWPKWHYLLQPDAI